MSGTEHRIWCPYTKFLTFWIQKTHLQPIPGIPPSCIPKKPQIYWFLPIFFAHLEFFLRDGWTDRDKRYTILKHHMYFYIRPLKKTKKVRNKKIPFCFERVGIPKSTFCRWKNGKKSANLGFYRYIGCRSFCNWWEIFLDANCAGKNFGISFALLIKNDILLKKEKKAQIQKFDETQSEKRRKNENYKLNSGNQYSDII